MLSTFQAELKANIRFGEGIVSQIGTIAAEYGKTVMVVTCPWPAVQAPKFEEILAFLKEAGLRVVLYDRACPNPTSSSIDEAAAIAREEHVDFFIGLGGGSAIDTAKGAALMFAHPGSVWEYSYAVNMPRSINAEILKPVIAVTTTSGTGSQVTPYCVLTNSELRIKSCVIANYAMIPTLSIVDPELMYSMPPSITASTGFDVFAHAFEAYLDGNATPLIETLALQAIELVAQNLVEVYKDGSNRQCRYKMAYADTLAGLCITMNNTTMPHDIGQAIVGKEPRITHGQSLAVVYPEYIKFLLPLAETKLAKVARLFDASLQKVEDSIAAAKLGDIIIEWQKELRIYASGKSLGLSEEVMSAVIEETSRTCAFITNTVGLNHEEISQMISRIWNQ